jgi:hypothetical protein
VIAGRRAGPRWVVLAFLLPLAGGGCAGPECVHPPCPLPTAFLINVTTADGQPLRGASLSVSGPVKSTFPCNQGSAANMCSMLGGPGTYDVRITAPGFQAVEQSIVVDGTNPECGCPKVTMETVDVALSPASGIQ